GGGVSGETERGLSQRSGGLGGRATALPSLVKPRARPARSRVPAGLPAPPATCPSTVSSAGRSGLPCRRRAELRAVWPKRRARFGAGRSNRPALGRPADQTPRARREASRAAPPDRDA